MNSMAEAIKGEHIQLTGAVEGRYVIRDRRADGELTIVPDTTWAAMLERSGGRNATPEEWDAFMSEYGPQMLPPDREG
jgi:hypothetical protein